MDVKLINIDMNLYQLHTNPEQFPYYDTIGKVMSRDGNIIYRDSDGQPHRDGDKPALISSDGNRWYKDGELHRDGDKPAIDLLNGNQWWYKNGKPHRDNDLPAVIYPDGRKAWFVNGKWIKSTDSNGQPTKGFSTIDHRYDD